MEALGGGQILSSGCKIRIFSSITPFVRVLNLEHLRKSMFEIKSNQNEWSDEWRIEGDIQEKQDSIIIKNEKILKEMSIKRRNDHKIVERKPWYYGHVRRINPLNKWFVKVRDLILEEEVED